jgi:hypothetical protein
MNEILISAMGSGVRHQPAVAAGTLFESGFMVVWTDAAEGSINGQRFAGDGNRIGDQFVVNTPTPTMNTKRHHPAVSSFRSVFGSGFVVAWIEQPSSGIPDSGLGHVKLQLFDDLSLSKIGPELQVDTPIAAGDAAFPVSVASLAGGGLFVAWVDPRAGHGLHTLAIPPDGFTEQGFTSAFRPTHINLFDRFPKRPLVTSLPTGDVMMTWSEDPRDRNRQFFVQRFSSAGFPAGIEREIGIPAEAITFLDPNHFVIAGVRNAGISDIHVTRSVAETRVLEDRLEELQSTSGVFHTKTEEVNSSFPALALCRMDASYWLGRKRARKPSMPARA